MAIVNIPLYTLPHDTSPDPAQAIRAATGLYLQSVEQKKAEAIRAKELADARQHDVTMESMREGAEARNIGLQGEETRHTLFDQSEYSLAEAANAHRYRLSEIGEEGNQARSTDAAAWNLRAPLERERVALTRKQVEGTLENQAWRNAIEANRPTLGPMASVIADELFQTQGGPPNLAQSRALIDIAHGRAADLFGTGPAAPARTPSSYARTLSMLSDPRLRQMYFNSLPPEVQDAVKQLMGGNVGTGDYSLNLPGGSWLDQPNLFGGAGGDYSNLYGGG